MEKIQLNRLDPVMRTLVLTLYCRARETDRPDAVIHDPKARRLLERIDWDPAQAADIQEASFCSVALRCREFDRAIQAFLQNNPDGVVIELGCGLDTRFERIDNGRARWFELDLPHVIAMRKQLLPESPRRRFLAASVLDLDWIQEVECEPDREVFISAEGLLMYLSPAAVKKLVTALRERFENATFMFDACTPLGVRLAGRNPFLRVARTSFTWGLRDNREIERWGESIRLERVWYYVKQDEPRLGLYRLCRYIPMLGRMYKVLTYRLGKRTASTTTG